MLSLHSNVFVEFMHIVSPYPFLLFSPLHLALFLSSPHLSLVSPLLYFLFTTSCSLHFFALHFSFLSFTTSFSSLYHIFSSPSHSHHSIIFLTTHTQVLSDHPTAPLTFYSNHGHANSVTSSLPPRQHQHAIHHLVKHLSYPRNILMLRSFPKLKKHVSSVDSYHLRN